MRRGVYILAALLWMCLMAACGDDEHFKVTGTIEGAPTFNMRFHYFGDDALHTGITASREGKFTFAGSSRQPVMVEIFDNDYHLMGRLYARNGDEIKCVLNRQNPYKSTFEGNDVNKRWTKFINANAEVLLRPGDDANALIAKYVSDNPDDIVSAMLISGSYDAARDVAGADSLIRMLGPDAHPLNLIESFEYMLNRVATKEASKPVLPMTFADSDDSLRSYNPRHSRLSLIVISDNESGRADSIVPQLRRLRRTYNDKQLAIVDFSVDRDTTVWKQSIRNDSSRWLQGWGAGSLASPAISRLGVRSLPFFVVADSTGKQLYRGLSIAQALKYIK